MPEPCCEWSEGYMKLARMLDDKDPYASVAICADGLGLAVPLRFCPACGHRLELVDGEYRLTKAQILALVP